MAEVTNGWDLSGFRQVSDMMGQTQLRNPDGTGNWVNILQTGYEPTWKGWYTLGKKLAEHSSISSWGQAGEGEAYGAFEEQKETGDTKRPKLDPGWDLNEGFDTMMDVIEHTKKKRPYKRTSYFLGRRFKGRFHKSFKRSRYRKSRRRFAGGYIGVNIK